MDHCRQTLRTCCILVLVGGSTKPSPSPIVVMVLIGDFGEPKTKVEWAGEATTNGTVDCM